MAKRESKTWAFGATAAAALVWSGSALALSGAAPTPPSGQLAATAPGGTEGLAGPRNVREAVRGGHAYPVVPDGRYRAHRSPPGFDPYGR